MRELETKEILADIRIPQYEEPVTELCADHQFYF